MTIEEATQQANAAVEAGDLDALQRALVARREALNAGEQPTLKVFEAGERLVGALRELQQRCAFESARLGQVHRYVEGLKSRD